MPGRGLYRALWRHDMHLPEDVPVSTIAELEAVLSRMAIEPVRRRDDRGRYYWELALPEPAETAA